MLAIRLDAEPMRDWLSKCPRLKQLLELFAPVEDPENVHARYIKWASFVPNDPECQEGTLERLDAKAWEGFLEKVREQLRTQQEGDQRRQFWELVNETLGYLWLADHGYTEIEFIPKEPNQKRADLIAKCPEPAILEVKTINRSDDDRLREKKRNDPAYLPESFSNLPGLVRKLTQRADLLSSFIWEQLPKSSQEVLAGFTTESPERAEVICSLGENLRRIIEGPCIYERVRFRAIPSQNLQDLTSQLLEVYLRGGPMGSASVSCLNRCLLDDAYPEELCKWSRSLRVEVFRPDDPVPTELLNKLEATIKTAGDQIETTVKCMAPEGKRILLLIVNRDFGCSYVSMKQLEVLLQKPEMQVVCQIGDF